MISIERCREILGTKAENLDDNFIQEMLSELYLLGEVLLAKATSDLSKGTHKNPYDDTK